jgi:hypothetical protein
LAKFVIEHSGTRKVPRIADNSIWTNVEELSPRHLVRTPG